MELDAGRIRHVVRAVADRLDGDWLLVGGALAAIWIRPGRTTEDVDLVAIPASQERRLALFQLADDLGLPVEALNTAADFFVERVPGWRDELETLHSGKRGTVYRPSPTLFLLLKLRRLSAEDLEDCVALVAKASREGLSIDRRRVLRALDALPESPDAALSARRDRLRETLAGA